MNKNFWGCQFTLYVDGYFDKNDLSIGDYAVEIDQNEIVLSEKQNEIGIENGFLANLLNSFSTDKNLFAFYEDENIIEKDKITIHNQNLTFKIMNLPILFCDKISINGFGIRKFIPGQDWCNYDIGFSNIDNSIELDSIGMIYAGTVEEFLLEFDIDLLSQLSQGLYIINKLQEFCANDIISFEMDGEVCLTESFNSFVNIVSKEIQISDEINKKKKLLFEVETIGYAINKLNDAIFFLSYKTIAMEQAKKMESLKKNLNELVEEREIEISHINHFW